MDTNEFEWCQYLREIFKQLRNVDEHARACESWIWKNVVSSDVIPEDVPEPLKSDLSALRTSNAQINRIISELFEALCTQPPAHFFSGHPLTRAQYYLLRAQGVDFAGAHTLGLSPYEDFRLFEMLYYEDDDIRCYINSAERPSNQTSSKVGLRFGRPPEELSRSRLRPEQVAFFEEYLPDVLARFGD